MIESAPHLQQQLTALVNQRERVVYMRDHNTWDDLEKQLYTPAYFDALDAQISVYRYRLRNLEPKKRTLFERVFERNIN
jgi:hypothetical protein